MNWKDAKTGDSFWVEFKVVGEKTDYRGYRTLYLEGRWGEFVLEVNLERKVQ